MDRKQSSCIKHSLFFCSVATRTDVPPVPYPCATTGFLLLVFWLVLILSPRLSAMPCDLARIRMWPVWPAHRANDKVRNERSEDVLPQSYTMLPKMIPFSVDVTLIKRARV